MPLLEIIQTRQISASIRLDEATATQVDQYAAFIRRTSRRCRQMELRLPYSAAGCLSHLLRVSHGNHKHRRART